MVNCESQHCPAMKGAATAGEDVRVSVAVVSWQERPAGQRLARVEAQGRWHSRQLRLAKAHCGASVAKWQCRAQEPPLVAVVVVAAALPAQLVEVLWLGLRCGLKRGCCGRYGRCCWPQARWCYLWWRWQQQQQQFHALSMLGTPAAPAARRVRASTPGMAGR